MPLIVTFMCPELPKNVHVTKVNCPTPCKQGIDMRMYDAFVTSGHLWEVENKLKKIANCHL